MNTKLSLSALAVGMAVSGYAFAGAAENRAVIDAIKAANGNAFPDITFANTWAGVTGFAPPSGDYSGTAWADSPADPCTFAGIDCTGGNITHIAVPNAALTMTAADFFGALAGIEGDLQTINYSVTTATTNSITGTIPDLSAFTAVTLFAVNGAGTSGVLPDMSAMTGLRYAGLNDSSFTGVAGQIGGSSLETLNINNNTAMDADLTSTLAASANSLVRLNAANTPISGQIPDYSGNTALNFFRADGSGLGGVMNLNGAVAGFDTTGAAFDVSNTGISAGTGTQGGSYSPAITAATLSTAAAGSADGTIDVTWTAPAGGADAYSVQTSTDSGVTWTESASTATLLTTLSGLATGNYLVRVVAYNTENNGTVDYDVQAVPSASSASIAVTADTGGTTTGGTTTGGTTTGGTTTSGTTTGGSSGGGGAAWLLLALPLLARRRRA